MSSEHMVQQNIPTKLPAGDTVTLCTVNGVCSLSRSSVSRIDLLVQTLVRQLLVSKKALSLASR